MRFFSTILAFTTVFVLSTLPALAAVGELQNPTQFKGVADFIAGALRAMVIVALPIISLAIVYSGFLFLKAQGNSEDLATAKRNLLYVVIGAILILGAWVIATLIGGTVAQLATG